MLSLKLRSSNLIKNTSREDHFEYSPMMFAAVYISARVRVSTQTHFHKGSAVMTTLFVIRNHFEMKYELSPVPIKKCYAQEADVYGEIKWTASELLIPDYDILSQDLHPIMCELMEGDSSINDEYAWIAGDEKTVDAISDFFENI